ncbi:MAG: NAD(P)-binding protein, partial [Erysipelotrichaceae bacterium]|nr:NAD(P)-binding protein [Erysipelotrichaceae bacterium]
MQNTKYLIVGAGISGLTFANYCNGDYLIVEKENEPGGYCRTIRKGDFVWDYAGHFFHFKTEELKKRFIESLDESQYVFKEKKTYIYYKGKLIDYPFQMNIHQLEKDEFIDCLYDLFNKEEKEDYNSFLEMLYGKFGKSITEKFLKPYNEKLYARDLGKLDKDAMGRFFPYADKEAIIKNMKTSANASYNSYFFYPKSGAEFIIDNLMS